MQPIRLRMTALRRASRAGLISLLLAPALAAEAQSRAPTREPGPPRPPPGLGTDPEARRPPRPPAPGFTLREATIDDIHRAIQSRRLTCTQLVTAYLDRIEAYSGTCTAYLDEEGNPKPPDLFMPSGKGIELGVLTAVPDAGQVNAFQNLNLRGQRSETDLVDDDPAMPDALEVAARLDAEFAATRKLSGPLHCIPIGIKDQMDTFDMRTTDGAVADYADDRPPKDATLVARLRDAGAIILGKTNMGEYASGSRSTYQGQTCNPYATDRAPGGSSSGSAAAVAANLVVCSIAEESLGSIRNPADSQGIVGFAPTRGLVPRTGNFRANLIRERYGPHCRTGRDAARIFDVISGYDPDDPITALSVGQIPERGYAAHASERSLQGKRLGVIREFMTRFSVVDEDGIRVANEAIAAMRAAGAEVLESVNPRDCALYGECGDPSIPDMTLSIQEAIEELLPTLEPSFVGEAAPSDTWPGANRLVPSFVLPAPFARFLDWAVAVVFDRSLFPSSPTETDPTRIVNLRRLNATPAGAFRQGLYGLNRYLLERGDSNISSIADLREFLTPCGQAEFESGLCGKGRIQVVDESPPSDTGTTLDTAGEAGHLFRQQALREIVLHVMAANDLDALVYPHSVIPPGPQNVAGFGNPRALENRASWNAFTDVSGLPDVVVPAGFTEVVYDAVDCSTPGAFSEVGAPDGRCLVKRSLRLPFGMCFHGRPFSEPVLFEIISGFESATRFRQPPPGFVRLAGEP